MVTPIQSQSNMKKSLIILAAAAATFFSGCNESATDASDWETRLRQELPAYGHRNWIVVADSAYPKQSNPGIETIYTHASQTETLEKVLQAIDEAPHVFGNIMVDAELAAVDEAAARGVSAYREKLDKLLDGLEVKTLPHDDIIRKLDEGGKLFNILLLKTDMTIPYTSVFINLECGYWDAEREAALRKAIAQ